MYNNIVRLPYTLWYDGKDKIFRMDMNAILPEEHYEDGKKYIGKIRNVQVSGYNMEGDIQPPPAGDGGYLDVSEWSTAVYNEEKHYADITLKPFSTFNADGEIALYIDFEMYTGFEEYISDHSYKKKDLTIIIPIRSHENPSKDPNRFNNGIGIDRMDVRNGFSHTVGANEDPIVFSFDLIMRDITDEFITNGQALDMVKNKSIESANLVANDSGLGLSLNWKSFGQLSWDNLKQYLGGSNSTEYVPPTLDEIINSWYNADDSRKSDFANAVGSKMTLSVSENSEKDIVVYIVQDVTDLSGQPNKSYNLLFTIPRALLGSEGGTVDTESIKNSILSAIQQQIPNATTIKQEILADVNPRIPDKEVIKQEVLAAVPTSSYELTPGKMNAVINELDYATETTAFIDNIHNHFAYDLNLKFIKTENSYIINYKNYDIMTIPFSSLREVTGGSSTFDSNNLDQMLTVLSSATNGTLDSLAGYILNSREFKIVKNDSNLTLKWQDTAGQDHILLQFRYEDVVDKQVITTFIREETKDFYTKQEVDQMIQQLRQELTANTRTEEHPQQ